MREFKEDAYKEPPRIDRIKQTIVGFGYGKLEARKLAYEITRNLDNYLNIMELNMRRASPTRPTQTNPKLREV